MYFLTSKELKREKKNLAKKQELEIAQINIEEKELEKERRIEEQLKQQTLYREELSKSFFKMLVEGNNKWGKEKWSVVFIEKTKPVICELFSCIDTINLKAKIENLFRYGTCVNNVYRAHLNYNNDEQLIYQILCTMARMLEFHIMTCTVGEYIITTIS